MAASIQGSYNRPVASAGILDITSGKFGGGLDTLEVCHVAVKFLLLARRQEKNLPVGGL